MMVQQVIINSTTARQRLDIRKNELKNDFINDFNKAVDLAIVKGINYVTMNISLPQEYEVLLKNENYRLEINKNDFKAYF